jgi:hypothetical protein
VSASDEASRRSNAFFAGAGLLMVLCCAAGPAVIGTGLGAAIGGWVGIVVACVAAAVAGIVLYRRAKRGGAC